MITYHPKPGTAVEAVQWTGGLEAAAAILRWISRDNGEARYNLAEYFTNTEGERELLSNEGLEIGGITANPGDWIVRLPGGTFVPMKPGDFEILFEIPDLSPTERVFVDGATSACREVLQPDMVKGTPWMSLIGKPVAPEDRCP